VRTVAPARDGVPRRLRAFVLERGGASAEGITVLAKRKLKGAPTRSLACLRAAPAGDSADQSRGGRILGSSLR
jgi:hypothetical protein